MSSKRLHCHFSESAAKRYTFFRNSLLSLVYLVKTDAKKNIICQSGDKKRKCRNENLTGEQQYSLLFQARKRDKREVNAWGGERDYVVVPAHASRFPCSPEKREKNENCSL